MDKRVQLAISLIQSDLRRELALSEIALHVNLSSSRLRHLFREETGMSPKKYLKSLRIKKAKYLLETTFLEIKEIMSKVGLTDHSHFTQDFKRTYGLSPKEYRKHHHSGLSNKS